MNEQPDTSDFQMDTMDLAAGLDGVAIIGMAGRFPGAGDVETFWRNLCQNVDGVTRFADGELEDSFSADERAQPDFVAARPILTDVDQFDAQLFRMRPREAALTDPQHRVFLEVAWSALENAGYDPKAVAQRSVGVFAGCSLNTYLLRHVCGDRGTAEQFTNDFQVGSYEMLTGAIADALATRVSYKLDLRGPSMTISTACSTSLTAVAQAVQALLLQQCEMALAGGVSITFPQKRGYFVQEGGMVSTDGVCRPFDAGANGTIFGSGAAAVLLKRLEDAVADGDHIYAVIKGAAVNNDGASKVGFAAPSVDAQAEVVSTAQVIAGFDPATIGYVECHGTATPLGDPIEVTALAKAFGDGGGPGRTLIGSVKGHVGHLDAAAGVTGLIKAALAVDRGVIPPTRNFTSPNPRLELEKTPFAVADRLVDWSERDGPRRAGVSALGVGGTNVHLCLEQAPAVRSTVPVPASRTVLTLSARSEEGLAKARATLAAALRHDPAIDLADAAHTLAAGRGAHAHRAAVPAGSLEEAVARLEATDGAGIVTGKATATDRPVLFMFPGQGAQYPAMGLELYREEPVYRAAVDRCADILLPHLGLDLREPLYGEAAREGQGAEAIRQTILAQPAIFTVEYALAQLWLSRGVKPAAMIGHSIGEFVAATLAGVFPLEDALKIVATRGRLMQSVPAGAMLAVRLPENEVRAVLPEGVDIAAVNAPGLTVAAGPFEAVERLEKALTEAGAMHKRLHTSHAFHSAMMEPVLAELTGEVAGTRLGRGEIPYVSCVTGTWVTEAETGAHDYWSRHCRSAVRFSDGVAALLARFENPVLLEVGPGSTLLTLARQGAAKGSAAAMVASLPDAAGDRGDAETFGRAMGLLWCSGAAFDRTTAFPGRRIPLPGVPFEHQSYWIAAPKSEDRTGAPAPILQAAPEAPAPSLQAASSQMNMQAPVVTTESAKTELAGKVATLFEELSGESVGPGDYRTPFLELGFDSLFLAQAATQLQKTFKIKITFRQLLNDMPSIAELTDHLAGLIPPPAAAPAPVAAPAQAASIQAAPAAMPAAFAPMPAFAPAGPAATGVEGLFRDQLSALQGLIAQQNQILFGQGGAPTLPATAPAVPAAQPTAPAAAVPAKTAAATKPVEEVADATPSRHQLYRPGGASAAADMTEAQKTFLADLIARYETRTAGSKRLTDQRRPVLADPRSAAGFRPEWKEIVYPIVCARSKGSRIWDVDGNEYIDVVNGYGQTAFGHAPDFVLEAVEKQMREGFAIGPQSPLAGEVAELFAEMTGNERVTFCNTGSEAVMAAMRVARAVTGRDIIVVFTGGYHGQFDEVLVKGKARQDSDPRGLPIAPGIPFGSVGNMVVLPWAKPESLDWIRQNSDEIAAVIAETVQSRHPDTRPESFLHELRAITEQTGSALVFDEVVTGFRVHPGGMQAVFGIRADMATYGKVVGGGMPIGVLGGKRSFMDALDGGAWHYGDASVPEVAPTFFAGTFVRHPLVLAAAKAVLLHLKAEGPALQEKLAARAQALAGKINAELARRGIVSRAESYSSWFYLALGGEDRLASLFYHHMRLLGVHWQEGFPCFFTTEHSDADYDFIYRAFVQTLDALQAVGIMAGSGTTASLAPAATAAAATPPAPTSAPLTEPQMEIWLAAQLSDEASCAFNESISVSLTGELDRPALTKALNQVVARHDALRARFAPDGSQMLIDPPVPIALIEHDFSAAGPQGAAEALADLRSAEAHTPFDLVAGPVLRVHLARLAPTEHVIVVTAHHIVCDGWSMNVIVQDLAQLYTAASEGIDADLPPAASYAAQAVAGIDADPAAEKYWLDLFSKLPAALEVPTDRPRPSTKTFRGDTHTDHIDAPLYRAVKKAGAARGATLFSTLLGAFQIVMGRLAGQSDVVVTVPMAGQALDESDGPGIVGHSVNFLPLRGGWDDATTLGGHLASIKRAVLDARDNQRCTLGTIVRQLGMQRDPNRLPLTDLQFNLERLAEPEQFGGLKAVMTPNAKAFVNYDMFFNIAESDAGLRLDIDYSTDLFDEATIARWVGHLRTLLQAMVDDMDQPVWKAPLLSAAEREALLIAPNATDTAFPEDRTFADLFEARAKETPSAIAVEHGETRLTYAELSARVDRIAAHLRGAILGREARIGVLLERSCDLPATLLAVAKAGFTYVPLDPHHPPARLAQIFTRSDLSALITDGTAEIDTTVPVIALSSLPATDGAPAGDALRAAPGGPAYVIFTSGSTGVPKGVAVGHRALTNLLTTMAARPGLGSSDTLLAVTTVSFDIAALELLLPLTVGARLVIASRDDAQDGFELLKLLSASKATVLQATPASWRMLIEAGFKAPAGFRMLCGGEALPRALADELLKGEGELWNMYGPTETTIWSSTARIEADGMPIRIGSPIANTRFYVLDAHNQPLAPGAVGELVIGGTGVADGYFGDPAQTAAKFLPDDVTAGRDARMYRTGDLARIDTAGNIILLGRTDSQVKLNGFRIELGEIETALTRLAGIAQAAVLLRNDPPRKPRLVAYYTTRGDSSLMQNDAIRSALSATLPEYMVPATYVRLATMPMTPNGKIDRRALPMPEAGAEIALPRHKIVPLKTPWQQQMGEIWKEVLAIDEVGAANDILELGADSIQIFQIVARARRSGITLAAKDLLRHRTIEALSKAVETASNAAPVTAAAGPLPRLADFRRR